MNRTGLKQTALKGSKMVLERPSPEQVLWMNYAVTYLCNGRCKMCHIWEKYRQEPSLLEGELSLRKVEELLSSEYLKHLGGISFTGGEPFLRKDFVDLAGLFIQKYPEAFIGIATNGLSPSLTTKKTREIVDGYHPRHLSLSFSLDGIGANHDGIRGVKGAYERLLRTVESIRQQTGVKVGFDFTVMPWNYHDLWSSYELSKEYGSTFIAGFAHNSDFYYGNSEMVFDWDSGIDDAAHILREVARDRSAAESLLDKLVNPYACFMAEAPKHQLNRTRIVECYSGVHSLFLDPYGEVYPCIILDEKFGNVTTEPFDQLWLCKRAAEIRSRIEQRRCNCWVACEAVPSLLRDLAVPKWNLVNKIIKPLVSRVNQHP